MKITKDNLSSFYEDDDYADYVRTWIEENVDLGREADKLYEHLLGMGTEIYGIRPMMYYDNAPGLFWDCCNMFGPVSPLLSFVTHTMMYETGKGQIYIINPKGIGLKEKDLAACYVPVKSSIEWVEKYMGKLHKVSAELAAENSSALHKELHLDKAEELFTNLQKCFERNSLYTSFTLQRLHPLDARSAFLRADAFEQNRLKEQGKWQEGALNLRGLRTCMTRTEDRLRPMLDFYGNIGGLMMVGSLENAMRFRQLYFMHGQALIKGDWVPAVIFDRVYLRSDLDQQKTLAMIQEAILEDPAKYANMGHESYKTHCYVMPNNLMTYRQGLVLIHKAGDKYKRATTFQQVTARVEANYTETKLHLPYLDNLNYLMLDDKTLKTYLTDAAKLNMNANRLVNLGTENLAMNTFREAMGATLYSRFGDVIGMKGSLLFSYLKHQYKKNGESTPERLDAMLRTFNGGHYVTNLDLLMTLAHSLHNSDVEAATVLYSICYALSREMNATFYPEGKQRNNGYKIRTPSTVYFVSDSRSSYFAERDAAEEFTNKWENLDDLEIKPVDQANAEAVAKRLYTNTVKPADEMQEAEELANNILIDELVNIARELQQNEQQEGVDLAEALNLLDVEE